MPGLDISARDLSYSYCNNLAVDNISIELAENEAFGFLRSDGTGKSTAMRLLTGHLTPKTGKARLLGRANPSQCKKVQQQISISFESAKLYDKLNAVGNLKPLAKLYSDSFHAPFS